MRRPAALLLLPLLTSAIPTPQEAVPASPGLGPGSLIHMSYAQFYTNGSSGSLNFKYFFWDQINATTGNTCFYTSCNMPFPYAKLENSTGTPKYDFTADSTNGAIICDPTRPHMGVNFTNHASDNGFDLHFLHTVYYANTGQTVQRDASVAVTSINYLLPSTEGSGKVYSIPPDEDLAVSEYPAPSGWIGDTFDPAPQAFNFPGIPQEQCQ
jgi:hypothetical protein